MGDGTPIVASARDRRCGGSPLHCSWTIRTRSGNCLWSWGPSRTDTFVPALQRRSRPFVRSRCLLRSSRMPVKKYAALSSGTLKATMREILGGWLLECWVGEPCALSFVTGLVGRPGPLAHSGVGRHLGKAKVRNLLQLGCESALHEDRGAGRLVLVSHQAAPGSSPGPLPCPGVPEILGVWGCPLPGRRKVAARSGPPLRGRSLSGDR